MSTFKIQTQFESIFDLILYRSYEHDESVDDRLNVTNQVLLEVRSSKCQLGIMMSWSLKSDFLMTEKNVGVWVIR